MAVPSAESILKKTSPNNARGIKIQKHPGTSSICHLRAESLVRSVIFFLSRKTKVTEFLSPDLTLLADGYECGPAAQRNTSHSRKSLNQAIP
ncbi:hypothetical protein CDAR_33241 [Caerostris darwini]|uniref:Uncharacterized protein n=1 Tax=Caerostris darwini TaxID=1538125 RepID=A0AAV4X202_9ARAC|nr:hypothetical protein CDAR_33241 [Caerostris darwini]